MKLFAIIFFTCIAGSLADRMHGGLGRFFKVCQKETGVDKAAVLELKKGIVEPDNLELDCFIACIMKRAKIMNRDGTLNEKNFRAQIPDDVAEEDIEAVLGACLWTEGVDDCDTASKMAECYLSNKEVSLLSW